MKTITVPANIQKTIQLEGREVKLDLRFQMFVNDTLLGDPRWSANAAVLRRSVKVGLAIDSLSAGAKWVLDDQDYALLKACAEEPTGGYKAPALARHALPFIDAIGAAEEGDTRDQPVPARAAAQA